MRLIASDLDGTLLTSRGELGPETALALRRVRRAGLVVMLLTSRPFRMIDSSLLGFADYLSCSNGAEVWSLSGVRLVREKRWKPPEISEVLRKVRTAHPDVLAAAETRWGTLAEVGFDRLADGKLDRARLREVASLRCDSPASKLMFAQLAADPDRLLADLGPLLGRRALVTHSGSPYVEVGASGSGKMEALAWVCEARQIEAAEVLAFGDMPNDLAMLSWAGQGVAVANAHPLVAAACGEAAASCDEEGVARYLQSRLVL